MNRTMLSERVLLLTTTAFLLFPALGFAQIQPANVSVASGQQQQFILQGSNGAVTWSVNPPIGMGTISPSGLYTAPSVVTASVEIAFVYARTSAGSVYSAMVSVTPNMPSPVAAPGTTAPSFTFPTITPVPSPSPSPNPSPSSTPIYIPSPSPAPTPIPSPSPSPEPIPAPGPTFGPDSGALTVPASIMLSPAYTEIQAGESVTFAAVLQGTMSPGVQWSLNPSIGTLVNGVYTAPLVVSGDSQVTITASSITNPSLSATATVLIFQAVTPVSVSLRAAATSISAGQSVNLTASVTGTTNTGVTWLLTPNIGTINNGVYTAPANLSAQQQVVVTATSLADPTKTASVALLLKPVSNPIVPAVTTSAAVGVTVSPGSQSLYGGQSATFTATVTGTSNTAVNWSINPSVGTITNGVYQAPAVVSGRPTITVTATSAADPAASGTAQVFLVPVAITVAPNSVSLAAGKSATFTASVTGSTNTAVAWSLSPLMGTIVNGVYTAPATIAAAQNVTITATSLADPTQSATATVSLTPSAGSSNATPSNSSNATLASPVTLPVEVMGPAGTTATVSVTVPSGTNLSGPLTLWMQIHGLKYDSEASVQVNNSAWLPISTANVTLSPLEAAYGGIGGGFHTLTLTMNLPAGVVVAGTNTVTFQFNGTDGVTSGYRVLQFNIQSAGTNLLPPSQFVQDDPNTWQPPSSAASDIAAGQSLWRTASLTAPGLSGPVAIQAHCGDCHSEDGRDLKYFNYSNHAIEARAVFHGLTVAQGAQIASYIRSLNVPNPGRPWNPPYQPGPGMDSQPVANWSAGAGLGAVLDSDADMQQYLAPGGSTAGWAASAYLNPRELPIPLQLPDWNAWLPKVHPIDAYGAAFTSSGILTDYMSLRSQLQPNNATAYYNAHFLFGNWQAAEQSFLAPIELAGNWTASIGTDVYSLAQWMIVKQWELNQENGLEAMPQVLFGTKANPRAWFGNFAFMTSPNMLHIPAGPAIGNGTDATFEYFSYIWYHTQLILNDGQGKQLDNNPLDYGYTEAAVKGLSIASGDTPAAMIELMWLVKALQENALKGQGPQAGDLYGFDPTVGAPMILVNPGWEADWSATSPATRTQLTTAYVQAWFAEMSSFTPAEYYAGTDGSGRPWASTTENPATDNNSNTFGGQIWFTLPRLRFEGVDPNLTYQISAWAATVFPGGNWSVNNAGTCINLALCTSD